jgi:hypothetical protein
MTSKKVLLSYSSHPRNTHHTAIRFACVTLVLCGFIHLTGCVTQKKTVTQPKPIVSPYPAPKAWAVLPFRNESGTSLVDGTAFADRLTQQIQQIEGIDVLPVNRVIETIFQGQPDVVIDTVDEIYELINLLDVDGVIVGTITAWDPYDPPKIGVLAQLYSRQRRDGSISLDTRRMSVAGSANDLPGLRFHAQPVTQVGSYYDAANGQVIKNLQTYATGRVPIDSPSGWRRYTLSSDLFSEYVSYELMREFFAKEWDRLNPPLIPSEENTQPVP